MPNPLDEANYRATTTSRGTVLIPQSLPRLSGGLWLYGSTRPPALMAHLVYGNMARLSARFVTRGETSWKPPLSREDLADWLVRAQSHIEAEVSSWVVQLPSDPRRRRFSLLLLDQGARTRGFAKFTVNPQNDLAVSALKAFRLDPPSGYWVPELLDAGNVGDYSYVLTTAMPNRPHLPARLTPERRRLVTLDVQNRLRHLVKPPAVPVHGDFGAWNVRSFLDGGLAIVDWETAGAGVIAADELWHILSLNPASRSPSIDHTVLAELPHHPPSSIAGAARFWLEKLSRPEAPEIDEDRERTVVLEDSETALKAQLETLSRLT